MKILLVVPKYNDNYKADYNYLFPLGLGYVSSIIKKKYSLDIINLNHYDGSPIEQLAIQLKKKSYDIILTGGLSYLFLQFKEIGDYIKSYTNSLFILGGPIVTADTEFIMQTISPDIGVLGECENILLTLINHIENNKSFYEINSITFINKKGELIKTSKEERIQELEKLPYPDFNGLEYEKYLDNFSTNGTLFSSAIKNPRIYSILGSRGCIFNCTFCYHPLGKQYTKRDIDSIIAELQENIFKYKINFIYLYDEVLGADKQRIKEFCIKLKKLLDTVPWDCIWYCNLHIFYLNDDILNLMYASGCRLLGLGIENVDENILRSMNKGLTFEKINNGLNLVKKYNMTLMGTIIFGDIEENRKTAKKNIDYILNVNDQIYPGILLPLPHSYIYKFALDRKIIKNKFDFYLDLSLFINDWVNMFYFKIPTKLTHLNYYFLFKKVILLRFRSFKKSKVFNIKKDSKEYSFTVRCPYCNKNIHYEKISMFRSFFFNELLICRNCFSKFRVLTRFSSVLLAIFFFVYDLYFIYKRTLHYFTKRKIKKKFNFMENL
jgi:radical SAM superfamily enzyme YgiQ (UPF0313 family)